MQNKTLHVDLIHKRIENGHNKEVIITKASSLSTAGSMADIFRSNLLLCKGHEKYYQAPGCRNEDRLAMRTCASQTPLSRFEILCRWQNARMLVVLIGLLYSLFFVSHRCVQRASIRGILICIQANPPHPLTEFRIVSPITFET